MKSYVVIVLSAMIGFFNACKEPSNGTTNPPVAHGPVVVTDSVTIIPPVAAILKGRIALNDQPITYHFEYGHSTGYGLVTSSKQVNQGVRSIAVCDTISALVADTSYHYRLVVQSQQQNHFGADIDFRTLSIVPPEATTGGAMEITATGATLHGAVNTRGLQTSYCFEYGLTASYGLSTPMHDVGQFLDNAAVTEHVSGLLADTVYHYRLLAQNVNGTTTGTDGELRTRPPQIAYDVYRDYSYGGPRQTTDTTLFFHTMGLTAFESLYFYIYDHRINVYTVSPNDLITKKVVSLVKYGHEFDSLNVQEVTLAGEVLTVRYSCTLLYPTTWTPAIPLIIVENETYKKIRFYENGVFVKEMVL